MMNKPEHIYNPDDLIRAVIYCDFDEARKLVAKGADVNAINSRGETALITAIEVNWEGTWWIKFLLENGADVNLPDADGDTPLDIARYQKREDIVSLLIQHGGIGTEGASAKEISENRIFNVLQHANSVLDKYKKKL